ncbi:PKD domain-containing protein [Dysgonomonas sp. 520]|uniref:PKD domain-containing protein n=1 Tax=Dysgonomonas sp. 520 TaxID=2302931 RepID=UPI0013D4E1A3|nr:PKD domain-containing protein [Dysgonomonas sp. 520]
MKKIKILLLLLACCTLLPAQVDPNKKYMNWWYFGEKSGLNFNQMQTISGVSLPTPVTGPFSTTEGCFTISDRDGNLLMSSDGMSVYNKNNIEMDNGAGLKGHPSSSQSGIVIPFPEDETKYYIITVTAGLDTEGLNYSIVDLTENGGLGKVTTKNINLLGSTYENITVAPNSNGRDYWLIHRGDGAFYVWSITSTGISTTPNMYLYTEAPCPYRYVSVTRLSPDNTKLISSSYNCNSLFYADFNPATGVVSNVGEVNFNDNVYGTEFSPSGEYIYVTQYKQGYFKMKYADLTSGTVPPLITTLGPVSNFTIGPDNKIYGIISKTKKLIVILDPDDGGNDVRIFDNYLINNANDGLPTFINGNLNIQIEEKPSVCSAYQTELEIVISATGANIPAQLIWNFGDGSSTKAVSYTGNGTYTQKHTYNTSGLYEVTVTPQRADGAFLSPIRQQIRVIDCPIRTNRMIRTSLSNSENE